MLGTSFLIAAALSMHIAAVHVGPCPGEDPMFTAGCYVAESDEIWVSRAEDETTLWHEKGHAFDDQRLDAGERARFTCEHGIQNPNDDESYCHTPWRDDVVELFAAAFSNCARGANPGRDAFDNGPDYWPTRRQHQAICRFINRASD